MLFIALPAFGLISLVWVFLQRMRGRAVSAAFVAASVLAIPYTHYAYSRPDNYHLAFGILPLLVGCLIIIGFQPRLPQALLALSMGFGSLWTIAPLQLAYYCERNSKCVRTEISGDYFYIDPQTARDVALLRELAAKSAPNGRLFLAVPFGRGVRRYRPKIPRLGDLSTHSQADILSGLSNEANHVG